MTDPADSLGPAPDPSFRARPARVLVVGGGIAGVELVVALRKLARERVRIELLSPGDELIYRPLLVAEPFGTGVAYRFPLMDILADQGAVHRHGQLASVQPGLHEATTDAGERLPYDALVVATGARPLPALEGALTFAGPAEVEPLRALVERAQRGDLRRLAFVVPEQVPLWPLPLYELALMTATRAPRAELVLVTPEHAPLELFGRAASEAVRARLEEAGVELHTGAVAEAVTGGELRLAGGDSIPVEAVVALPLLEVPPLPGLPQGEGGFLAVDEHCRVEGRSDVYAAGDVTSFRVKQGGFAARQAQTVAAAIAARTGAPVSLDPLHPVLHGLLLTGSVPRYLEAGGQASHAPLWWPPTKIADSYLLPYLVSRFRVSVPSRPTGAIGDVVATALEREHVPARRPHTER
jgi:sulfide:quinone oxidoreductase